MAAAANATYRLGLVQRHRLLPENLNAGSGNSTFEIGALGTSTTFGGTITDNGGTVGITKTGGGTLTLTGPNNYTGPTTINAGVLQIGDGGATGALGTGLLTNNAALVVNRSDAVNVAGGIAGSGTFTQAGAGTTTLSGGNTYAGTTYVNQGALILDGSTDSAGRIDVSSGATLGGGGTGGIVTVADGGIFAPGGADNDIVLASLTLAGTPVLKFNVDAPSVTPSFYNDYANIAGALVLNGRIQVGPQPGALDYDFTTAVPGDKWLILSYAGALGGSGLVVDSAPALAPGLSMTVDTATAGSVFLAVVPESGTGALVMLGLALLLRRRFPVTGNTSSKTFR
ncbi:MAG: autotransporter-associated beta strand repeat-containing protein [Kiritimatiellia bacterium]